MNAGAEQGRAAFGARLGELVLHRLIQRLRIDETHWRHDVLARSKDPSHVGHVRVQRRVVHHVGIGARSPRRLRVAFTPTAGIPASSPASCRPSPRGHQYPDEIELRVVGEVADGDLPDRTGRPLDDAVGTRSCPDRSLWDSLSYVGGSSRGRLHLVVHTQSTHRHRCFGRRRLGDGRGEVDLDGGQQVTASITKDAVTDLGLATGRPVTVLVKSTEVMLGVEYRCSVWAARGGVGGGGAVASPAAYSARRRWIGPLRSRSEAPAAPLRRLTISDAMDSAISPGVRAPMSRPAGP